MRKLQCSGTSSRLSPICSRTPHPRSSLARQLLHSPNVAALMDVTFFLTLDRDEARTRRTRPRCPLNPNPLSTQDFDELLWPTHESYEREKVAPLEANAIQMGSPRPLMNSDGL
jgi:hypothetical protein